MAITRKTRSAASRKASAAKGQATRKANAKAASSASSPVKTSADSPKAKAADKPVGKPKTTARWQAMQAADKSILSPHCRDTHGLCEKDKAYRAVATAYFSGVRMTGHDLKLICPSTRCSFWAKAFVAYLDIMTGKATGSIDAIWGNNKSLTNIVPTKQRGMAMIEELRKAASTE